MLISEIKKLQLQKELISIRRDCHCDDITGIVEFINDEVTLMCMYDDDGYFDGFSLFYTDQITEVLWGNREHFAIKALVKKYGQAESINFIGDTFEILFNEFSKQYKYLCIFTDDEDVFDIALVEKLHDDWLKIKALGPKKTLSDVHKILKFSDVARIDFNKPYQNKIIELHNSSLKNS